MVHGPPAPGTEGIWSPAGEQQEVLCPHEPGSLLPPRPCPYDHFAFVPCKAKPVSAPTSASPAQPQGCGHPLDVSQKVPKPEQPPLRCPTSQHSAGRQEHMERFGDCLEAERSCPGAGAAPRAAPQPWPGACRSWALLRALCWPCWAAACAHLHVFADQIGSRAGCLRESGSSLEGTWPRSHTGHMSPAQGPLGVLALSHPRSPAGSAMQPSSHPASVDTSSEATRAQMTGNRQISCSFWPFY